MQLGFDFQIHKEYFDGKKVPQKEQEYDIVKYKNRAIEQIGESIIKMTGGFTVETVDKYDMHRLRAIVFKPEDWDSFCKQLRAVDYLKCADDLIKKLENK